MSFPRPASALRHPDIPFALGAVFIGMLGVWWGLPWPHIDDPGAVGAAVSIAGGHGLRNPWLHDWLGALGTDRYFSQPPIHAWSLGAWLRLWGVSTTSLLAFQWLCIAVVMVGVARWLRRLGGTHVDCLLGAALACGMLLTHGLRHDTLAFALMAAGFTLVDASANVGVWLIGYSLIALAPATMPLTAACVLPGLVWHGWANRPSWRTRLGWAAGGLAVAVALLSFSVGHAWAEFWRVFTAHARMRAPSEAALGLFQEKLTFGYEASLNLPVWLALAACTWIAFRRGDTAGRRFRLAPLCALVATTVFAVALYARAAAPLLPHLALATGAVLLASLPTGKTKSLGVALLVGAALVRHSGLLLSLASSPHLRPTDRRDFLTDLAHRSPSRLVVDHIALREVFDYRPPANAVDWLSTLKTAGPGAFDLARKPPTDAWLVSEYMLAKESPGSSAQPRVLQIGRHRFGSIPLYPQPIRWAP